MPARCLVAFVFAAAFGAPLVAQQSQVNPDTPREIADLIATLGSDQYPAREAATERLAALGPAAIQAVQGAATHPNREIRYRSQRIIEAIREREIERRLQAFLNQTNGSEDPPLAGWSRFRDRFGDTEHSRSLLVAIHRANPELMNGLESSPRLAAERLTEQVARDHHALQFGGQNLDLGEIAATLFVAGEPDILLPPHTLEALFSHCYQPSFSETLTGGDYMPLARKMLGRVILRSEDRSAVQAMHVASRFNLHEGIAAAKRVLERQEGVEATSMTQVALMTVGQLGDSSHLPLIERLLLDSRELSRMQENTTTYVVELRDVALATAVMLTRQDLKSYFAVPAQHADELQLIFFDPRVVGFESESRRVAVFARWARYKAGHPNGK